MIMLYLSGIVFMTILKIEKEYKPMPNIALCENDWKKERVKKDWVGGFKSTNRLIKSFQILIGISLFINIVCIIAMITRLQILIVAR